MQWLLCDYGEVLSLPPPEADRAKLEDLAGWTKDEDFMHAYWAHRPSYDRADLTAAEYWQRVVGHEAKNLKELIAQDVAMWLHPNQDSIDALAGAPRLALLSNAPIEVAEGIDGAPWVAPFTKRFFSCYLRATKPDPAAYEAVLRSLDAEPAEVVFVDDRPANVEAARQLGIDAHLYTGPARIRELVSGLRRRRR